MGLKAPSNLGTNPSRFTRLPNKFTRSSKITQTVPTSSVPRANIRVVFGVTADHTATFRRSANVGVAITASATGLNTGGLELGTAVVSVGITSTASSNVTRSGVASIDVGITSTCTGTLTVVTHTGTADISVGITVTAREGESFETSDTVAWWDANRGLTYNGVDRLSSWTDRYTGTTVSVTGTSPLPTYNATGGNSSNPVINFGTDSRLTASGVSLNGDKLHAFIVLKHDNSTASGRVIGIGSANPRTTITYLSNQKLEVFTNINSTQTNSKQYNAYSGRTDWHILEVSYNGTGWSAKTHTQSSTTNLTVGSTGGTYSGNIYNTGTSLNIGGISGTTCLDAHIADVLIYDDIQTGTNLTNIIAYFRDEHFPVVTHTGTADCQVNIDIVATGEIPAVEIPDETANDNVMTLYGDPTFTSASDAAIGTRAVVFDGSGDFGVIEDTFQSTFRSPFSISMWVKPDDGNPSTDQHIWSTYENPSSGVESWFMALSLLTTGKLQWRTVKYLSGGGSDTYRKTSSSSVWGNGVASTYSHIIVTVSSSGVPAIYNGTATVALTTDQSDTLAISGWLSQGAKAKVGSFSESGYGYFAGKIDNVAVWSTSLTSSERSALYNNGSGSDLTGSSDLAGWWKMGEGSTATIVHTGTASISASITASATGASVAGFANDYSISCDGLNDSIDLGSSFQSTFRDSFSISFWIKLTDGHPATSYTPNLFGVSMTGSAHRVFGIIGNESGSSDGKLSLYYKDGSTQVHTQTDSAAFTNGSQGWAHLVYTATQATNGVKIYKDGSELATSEASGSMNNVTMSNITLSNNLLFGARNQNGSPAYWLDTGYDEISIWDTALTSTQVSNIYNSGTPTDLSSDSNLVGYWRFEENTGTSIADSSTNSNSATLTNGPTFSTPPS